MPCPLCGSSGGLPLPAVGGARYLRCGVCGLHWQHPDDRAFADWHYIRDPTHVSFYSDGTLRWIARHFGWSLTVPRPNVALYRVPAAP